MADKDTIAENLKQVLIKYLLLNHGLNPASQPPSVYVVTDLQTVRLSVIDAETGLSAYWLRTETSADYPVDILERVRLIANPILLEHSDVLLNELNSAYLTENRVSSFCCHPIHLGAGCDLLLWLETRENSNYQLEQLDIVERMAEEFLIQLDTFSLKHRRSIAQLVELVLGANNANNDDYRLLFESHPGFKALENHLRIFERAIKSADTGFIITDPRLESNPIVYCNPAFEKITGYSFAESVGKNCRFLQGKENDQPGLDEMRRAIEKREGVKVLLRNFKKDGTLFWNELTISPIFDELDRLTHFIGMQTDATKRIEAERALANSEERYKALFNNCLDGIAYFSLDGHCIEANQAYCEMLGYTREEIVNISYTAITPKRWHKMDKEIIENQILKRGYSDQYEKEYIRKNGSAFPVSIRAVVQVDENDKPVAIWGVVRDVSESKKAMRDIRRQGDLLNETGQLAHVGGWEVNLSTGEVIWTDEVYRIFSADKDVKPTQSSFFEYIHPDFCTEAVKAFNYAIKTNTELSVELPLIEKLGSQKWIHFVGEVKRRGNKEKFMYGAIQDITQRKEDERRLKENESKMQYLAHHDPLTKMPNRLLFHDRLRHGLHQARRRKSRIGLMLLDLDRFKIINDSLGHDVGDFFLKEIANRLTSNIRDGDTAARIGGDEFVIILDDIAHDRDLSIVADKMLQVISKPVVIQGQELFSTASIGISVFPLDGKDVETLLKTADSAMYKAKEKGKNNFQYYTEDINKQALELLVLESDLRRAVEREEFFVEYQPQFNLNTGDITGCEALIRWMHPKQGIISPGTFIPIAEETGLIVPIGNWMINTCCRQAKYWVDEGLFDRKIAVNLSARQFRQPGLGQVIKKALTDVELPAQYLELEITESVAMDNVETTVATLERLKEMGLELSIDDFGTGYSSLSYLKRFAIDKLKIDQSFVRDIVTDPNDAAIAASTIALAHKMNLKVIAEGVENQDQVAFLKAQECDEVQGYFYGKPMSAKDFELLLRQRLATMRKRSG